MRMFFALSGSLLAATLSLPAFALERDVLAPNAPAATPGAPAAITAALDAQAEEPPQSRLDTLFSELKRERNERAAERIANRIQEEWNRSGSASIDLMMGWSRTAIENKKFDVALDFLDQVTTMKPDYAEGWNRRATVHFLMNNYAKSMADISLTLQIEPRHFGALSGVAQIMKTRGNTQLALDAWQRVLDVYPMLRGAQDEVASLSEELTGDGI